MEIIGTRRRFFGKFGAALAFMAGAPKLFSQQGASPAVASAPGGDKPHHKNNHIQNGIYYFSGTGANDDLPDDDHVLVTDPFEKHVTRTMDALKKTLERAGSNMDSIVTLQVFLCLPLADGVPMPTGKARFGAHHAQYVALNKIYGTYFSPGKAPSRSCMALEWIPGDSLIEISGCAMVLPPAAAATPPAGE